MARRSSARLRGRESSTPKRVSLSHEVPARTPRTVPAKLPSLEENEEMPGAFPASPSIRDGPPAWLKPAMTPTNITPIKPSSEEMHPQHHQQTTAKPMQEARHLGFTNMAPHTAPPKHSSRLAALQETPTRSTIKPNAELTSPGFKFTFQREHSLELSPDAKRLMLEKREEAARIRQQMVADGEGVKSLTDMLGRPIAIPRGTKGRFDDAHSTQFQKMNSIANHPSSFRADPNRLKISTPSSQTVSAHETPKSLKRSPSKAELDVPGDSVQTPKRSMVKSVFPHSTSQIFRSTPLHARDSGTDSESASSAKRVKRSQTDNASPRRVGSSIAKSLPTTPKTDRRTEVSSMYPDLSKLATPTQSSMSHVSGKEADKISRIPGPQPSAIKNTTSWKAKDPTEETGPLLARSPSKGSIFAKRTHGTLDTVKEPASPLLSRSPSKASLFDRPSKLDNTQGKLVTTEPLLLRSPSKLAKSKTPADMQPIAEQQDRKPSLLHRSPMKMPATKEAVHVVEKPSDVPLLSRSPSKISMSVSISTPHAPPNSEKTNLLSRFNLLRSTPVKSILRSPQRLYSDDPAKVAAGTHMTPPRQMATNSKAGQGKVPATAPVSKRVDFSSSTKACDDDVKRTPSKASCLPLKFDTQVKAAPIAGYPTLPMIDDFGSPSPQKRRQTATPADFTFRAGEHKIIFSRSPSAPVDGANLQRPSTIRHVSAHEQIQVPPVTGSKKRKFEFENDVSIADSLSNMVENKENIEETDEAEARPAKRTKTNPVSPAPPPAKKPVPAQRNTPGVKPRGTKPTTNKRTNTISQARLSALSQPKRRA